MSELFEKSMATLELPQVLALLADCAATLEGKERCLALRPLTDLDDVARAQEETSAAVKMLILRGSPGFSGVKPVSASLQRADMGGSLSTRELLEQGWVGAEYFWYPARDRLYFTHAEVLKKPPDLTGAVPLS